MSYYRFRHQLTPGIRVLIIINTVIFVIGLLLPQLNRYLIVLGGLVPELFLKKFYLWQPLTYMFLHGGFMHIFFNMFALWMFGTELERHWGTSFFMKFYFVSGIGAGILSAVIQPASTIPIIGASGAIYGILLGFAVMYPNRIVYLNFLVPIKVKYFVMIFAAIELMASMGGAGRQTGVAHLTHLSGMAFGYLYLLWHQHRRRRGRRRPKFRINFRWSSGKKEKDHETKKPEQKKPGDGERELDALMDRIARDGYESLSEKEKVRLLELTGKYKKKE